MKTMFFLMKFIFGILLVMALLLYGLVFWISHPSDIDLITNFERKKSNFVDLIMMIQSDKGLERVDEDWTRPSDPLSIGIIPERIARYRQLMDELKIARGFESSLDPTVITLIASASGLSISGSAKGYVYSEIVPNNLVSDLDNYLASDGKSFVAYRHIEGHWYLYLEIED